VAAVEQVVGGNPESADALQLLSELKVALGDPAGARAALERAVTLSPATPSLRFR
jgi:cytochrome c-type biogenesis protein CcmH/NrfG